MRISAAALLASLPFAASCASSPAAESASPAIGGPVSATAWAATIAPRAATGTQITGRFRLVPTGRANELKLEGTIRGAGFQTRLPWTIKEGACGEGGSELGNPLAYREITTGPDGSATLSGTVQVTIPTTGTYHIAILPNSRERERTVACGVLSPA